MGKTLVIVESPAKVKTISKFLGKNFIVKSSIGHIRDLATSTPVEKTTKKKTKSSVKNQDKNNKISLERTKIISKMGVDPENNWKASYAVLAGKEKVLKALQEAAEKVEKIYLATDLDREGEAIAWHLMEAIGGDKSKYERVVFTEITKNAIKEAFEHPTALNINRVNAQQARRFLDRVVGFMLSPLLWAKVARGLSAGRVQSVAVRLISERESAIHAFKPDEYWEIFLDLFSAKNQAFSAQVIKKDGQSFRPVTEKETFEAVDFLKKSPYHIEEVEKKPSKTKPSAPFITSTLQQAASVRLGYGVKKTMMLAQRLYEEGHITYMRTDSTNLSKEAIDTCRSYIENNFGTKYLPEEPIIYSSKKTAQEAHEAIRPTDVAVTVKKIELDDDAKKVYHLIWQQFVACQMASAEYHNTNVSIKCGPFEAKARGRILIFDGFTKVLTPLARKEDSDKLLPDLASGEKPKLEKVNPSQHFTKPPPRYTEASLVRELEKRGIGRPSTYASIISTIQDRGYAKVEKRRFFCLKMGDIVTDRLRENFQDLMDYGFTASMEEELDKIAQGQANWLQILDDFYASFTGKLDLASESMRGNPPTPTDIKCPECERPMNIRTARTGVFLSCSGYELPPKERCKGTINLIPGKEVESFTDEGDDEEGNVAEVQAKRRCQKCDTAMDSYLIDETRELHVCGNNPECNGYFIEFGKFRIKGYEGPIITCDKCNADMQLKTGRFGKYFGCTRAPDCKNTRKLMRNGEAAPPRVDPIPMPELKCEKSDGYFILRDGAAGIFLASSKFPRSKETRKPLVADLVRHKKELDPKYLYLSKAPETDPEGNPAIIRYSKKTQEHFVMSEVNAKPTNWAVFYENGTWREKKS